jgi:hypothetical protein
MDYLAASKLPAYYAPDYDTIALFFEAIYEGHDWQEGECIALRGLQEKGVPHEGRPFMEQRWSDPGEAMAHDVFRHAERWNAHGHGAFLVPGVMRSSTSQREEDVAAFTCLCLDLDDEDKADSTLQMLSFAIGQPTVVVESSQGKRHVYWRFSESQYDVARVAKLRHTLALKSGGDPSFGKPPQVIRIPGSVHGKFGTKQPVSILSCEPYNIYDIEELAEKINELHPLPSAKPEAREDLTRLGYELRVPGSDYRPEDSGRGVAEGNFERVLEMDVYEGGASGITRHDALGVIIGGYINKARRGEVTLEEAKGLADEWMQAHMKPPFEHGKFMSNWDGILKKDVARNGELIETPVLVNSSEIQAPEETRQLPVPPEVLANPLLMWGAHRWAKGETPKRRWMVQGLVRVGVSHVLAAEGGVGKTTAIIDLGLKIAAPRYGDLWMGQPLNASEVGGTVVFITAEDDQDELHIRLDALDPGGERRQRAGDKLIVLPLLQAGGAFPLVELQGGVAKPSKNWNNLLEQFSLLPDLKLVAIDTLAATAHGEENSALVLQQYVSALNAVQRKVRGCATMVTHHVRKQGTGKNGEGVVSSVQDMRNAIRGSNALLGAVRMVIGVWQPPKWRDVCMVLEREQKPNTIFLAAVVKGNNPEVMEGERVLARAANGGFEDVTAMWRAQGNKTKVAHYAWIVAAVERAVADRLPYTTTGKNGLGHHRHGELGDRLPGMNKTVELINELVEQGRLVRCKMKPSAVVAEYLDVPGGMLEDVANRGQEFPVSGVSRMPDWNGWELDPSDFAVKFMGTSYS